MRKVIVLIGVYIVSVQCYAQQIKPLSIDTFIYNKIYKNIAAYNIRYGSLSFNKSIDKMVLEDNSKRVYEQYIADLDYKLEMVIEKVNDIQYRGGMYALYSVKLPLGLYFKNQKTGASRRFLEQGVGTRYLVGIKDDEIKFLSGKFFVSAIAKDYDLNVKYPNSYIDFLKMKGFEYDLQDIVFLKKKRNILYYNCYSNLFRKKGLLILNLENVEYFELKLFN